MNSKATSRSITQETINKVITFRIQIIMQAHKIKQDKNKSKQNNQKEYQLKKKYIPQNLHKAIMYKTRKGFKM